MPIENYGVLKGRITECRQERDNRAPHYHIRVRAAGADARVSINVQSHDRRRPDLLELLFQPYWHRRQDEVEAALLGRHVGDLVEHVTGTEHRADQVLDLVKDALCRLPQRGQPAPVQLLPWQPRPGVDHLDRLGVNTVYLTPFFPARSNHRYDASTFDRISHVRKTSPDVARTAAAVSSHDVSMPRIVMPAFRAASRCTAAGRSRAR